ncbi:hypothetical protein LENED_009982 [Lentinula edodes]|uniref:Uncharacterized protein n=1 Tax=Lentinula edodes TaxID=5353 RepID=A0A1Q3EL76_LENED|nr:hypothetical protein LENED_009982 [Lentinula edodes]
MNRIWRRWLWRWIGETIDGVWQIDFGSAIFICVILVLLLDSRTTATAYNITAGASSTTTATSANMTTSTAPTSTKSPLLCRFGLLL